MLTCFDFSSASPVFFAGVPPEKIETIRALVASVYSGISGNLSLVRVLNPGGFSLSRFGIARVTRPHVLACDALLRRLVPTDVEAATLIGLLLAKHGQLPETFPEKFRPMILLCRRRVVLRARALRLRRPEEADAARARGALQVS